jgi:hypothetical protein
MENKIMETPQAKRAKRSTELIANFVEGCTTDWSFAIKECFKKELNIEFTERKKDRATYYEWTQGPYYCFSEGQVFYDVKEGYTCWQEALKNVNHACQIITAKPNIPLKIDNEITGKTKFKVLEGYVQFSLFKPNDVRTKLVHYSEHTLSQNDFVTFLKTGEIKGEK